MKRFFLFCLMMGGVATAQTPEQVLPSTPIFATAVAENTPQQPEATKTAKALVLPSLATQNTSGFAVGATSVNSGVSPTGAFTYEVPIAVPPGVQDVQPNIALSYNSQSGNGLAGWGWNISGLSTISRVGSTLHHDGVVDAVDFDGLDRFALDGQRLIVTSGTYGKPGAVYTTENYANIKITSIGTHPKGSNYGPKIFVAHYPDGSKAYYGYSSLVFYNGRIRNASSNIEWVITKWVDAQGNQIHYSYAFSDTTGGTLRVTKIAYGDNEVIFHYKNRSRHETSFVGGQYATRKNILSYIEVKCQGRPYRKYTLSHQTTSLGYQKVTQLQETDRSGAKRMPVVFRYQSNNTQSSIESNNMPTAFNPGIQHKKTELLTGNLNRDANLDFVAYNKDRKDSLHIYTGAFTTPKPGKSEIARTVKMPKFDEAFTASVKNGNGGMDAFQRVVTVEEKIVNHRAVVSFKVFGEMPNDEDDKITIDYTKTWNAAANTKYFCNDTPYLEEDELVEEPPIKTNSYKIPKTYISGDFNGDGLTDVLAIQKSYTRTSCSTSGGDCDDDRRIPYSYDDGYSPRRVEDCGCQCNYYPISGGSTYLINLDRNTSQTSYGIGNIPNFSSNDRLLAADFNGDGKTDLWHMSDKNLKIYSVTNNRLTKIGERSNDNRIKTYLPMLLGDYNGDGKIDFLTPKAEVGTKTWHTFISTGNGFWEYTRELPFAFQQSTETNSAHPSQYYYIPQDFNQDGKTDIIKHSIERSLSYDYDISWYSSERIELFENNGNGIFNKTANFFDRETEYYESTKLIRPGIPVITGINTHNKKMQYALLSGSNVKRYEIDTPHKANMRLRAVTNHGVQTQIDYAGLDAKENASVYQRANGLQYPFVHINHAPGMELVSKLTQSVKKSFDPNDKGHIRTQQFKYKGAVSHMHGLGFMGFTGLARSNLYGDNVAALWTVSKQDPKLRGATTEQWTDPSYAFNRNCYISKTVTGYHTELRPNRVYVSVPKHMATHNNLTGVLHERFFTYDRYFNLETEREKTEGLDKTTTYRYYNNPSPTDANYHIGRLRWEKTLAKVPGAADFWTEKDYSYHNNLLQTEKARANGSNWRSTTYTYTHHGNVETKTLSVPGKPARAERFTYYPNGRDLKTHTDVLGLTTSYEYHPCGALKKETDPYGNSTHYTYDGWNRLDKTTNYLGRVTEVTYAHRTYGGVVKTINHPNTAADTRTYYNALGWIDELHTQVSSSQWSKVYYHRDVAGRVRRESVPDFNRAKKWNVTEYDLYGRIALLQEATGRTIHTDYDGLRTQVSDGTKTATTTKNALDQIVELADPGGTIRYAYHPNGELRQADYGGYVVSTEIDNWGRKSKLIDPTAGTFSYTHNDWGELVEETAPKGKTVYKYDAYGRITHKEWTGSLTNMKTTYVYTPDTKLLDYVNTTDSQNNTTHRITYTYDAYKRIKKLHEAGTHANFSKTINYDYYGRVYMEGLHATDNKSKKTYNTNVVYSYDVTGSTDKLSYRGYSQYELWRATERNALGQVTKSKTGNGFTQTKTIDDFGFVSRVRDYKSGASAAKHYALNLSYTFDRQRGLLMARSDHLLGIENQQFVYDNMDRLTEAHHDRNNQTRTRTRGYDPRGRLTQDTFMGINLTYGSGNDRYRLTGAELNPNGVAYYNKHNNRKLTYNADRKPVEVHDVGNGRITFNYSHDGHRQEVWYGGEDTDKTQRNYHKTYSRIAPIELVRDTENNTQKFLTYLGGDAYTAPVVHVQDNANNSPNGHHYLHRDYLGSILAVSNNSGEVIERAHFGAWGDETDVQYRSGVTTTKRSDSLTGRGFTGHEHFTEVGLIHMNGRMYDAQQGRFLSPDNHIQDPFNTQNFNRYGYVLNNPLSLTDPSGEFIFSAIIGALIGVVVNGINNSINGQGFFKGWGKAALFGAISGTVAFGIGEAALGIKGTFLSTGIGSISNAAAFQFVAHGALGGFMTMAQGGKFGAGFLSGGFGSAFGGKVGKWLTNARDLPKFIGTTIAGGISGGVGSRLAGGKFWDGFRNGAISAGLNHAAHSLRQRLQNSIKVNGKELNPGKYELSNRKLRLAIKKLYMGLIDEVGHSNFDFEVTGGDRYGVIIDGENHNLSSTNNQTVTTGKYSAHNIEKGARAVDLRIGISYKIVEPIANSFGLHYQSGYYPHNYSDGHHHLYLLNYKKNWAINN